MSVSVYYDNMRCTIFSRRFVFSSRRRHTRCALVTGVQTCALPIYHRGLAAGLVELHHAGPPWVLALDPGRRAQGVDAVLEVGGSGRRRLPRLLADVAETVERRDALAIPGDQRIFVPRLRSEEHTSELQSLMRTSYAVFCLKKKKA